MRIRKDTLDAAASTEVALLMLTAMISAFVWASSDSITFLASIVLTYLTLHGIVISFMLLVVAASRWMDWLVRRDQP